MARLIEVGACIMGACSVPVMLGWLSERSKERPIDHAEGS